MGAEKVVADPLVRRGAHPPGQRRDRRAASTTADPNSDRSRGWASSVPETPSTIWSWMPPMRLATTGAALPHRLGHREAEALGQALLHHHVRVALQGIDDRRVLIEVVHRQRRQVHPRSDIIGQAMPAPRERRRTRRRPRDRRPPRPSRGPPAADGRRCEPRRCSANPLSTPSGSLSRSQRETCTTTRSERGQRSHLDHLAQRSTRPGVPSDRVNVGSPRPRSDITPAWARIASDCLASGPHSWARTRRSTAG